MRSSVTFSIQDSVAFKGKLLQWGSRLPKFCILDSNNWNGNDNELIAAAGSLAEISPYKNSFEKLKEFRSVTNDWLFGYLSYDLKNEIEDLSSNNFDGLGFAPMHFFQPKYVFVLRGNKLEIQYRNEQGSEKETEAVFREIAGQQIITDRSARIDALIPRVSREAYIRTIDRIRQHILRGDIYEMNYCMEFFSENAEIDPAAVFLKLSETSQAPFSAFYKMEDKFLMCASPERFLKKGGRKIISQPIKGTAKRGDDVAEDVGLRNGLRQNEKEKSENVMIVDLVRNDLSKTCDRVKVDELFGVYTFEQWHQMISTVSGELRAGTDFTEVIKTCFPMGSMTGAPKVRAMELIEQYEKTKRGLYSGAVGYLTPPHSPEGEGRQPEGWRGEVDFDLNVVIRSILYNAGNKYLSFQVGSAITANAVPEQEYEECLLKAKGMFSALGAESTKPDPDSSEGVPSALSGLRKVQNEADSPKEGKRIINVKETV